MSLRLTAIAALAAPLLVGLAACQAPAPRATGGSAGDPQAAAFCRQRAEEVFNAQNRSARIQSDNRDTPFSGSFVSGVTNRGLSDRFALDQMVSDCMRNAANRQSGPDGEATQQGAQANPSAGARPAPATAPATARALAQPGSGSAPVQPTSANAPASPSPGGAPLDRAPPPPPPAR